MAAAHSRRIRPVSVLLLLLASRPLLAAEPIPLRAGPLSMVFEPDNALLRYLQAGEAKVLQGINAPVRDQYWGTVPPVVENLQLQREEDSFTLSFDVSCRQGEIDFTWKGHIAGTPEGRVTFTFDGEAGSSFLRNRIGFCVLHGPEAAGRRCVIETVDGETREGRFPTFISPHQPFKNIRAIRHEVSDGVWATVRMEGDTFEMEDQRNWTDASFKTYCTPLELPFPVRVEPGTRITQKVAVSIEGAGHLPPPSDDEGENVVLQVSERWVQPMPDLGLQVSSQVPDLSRTELARLRELNLDHLRVDLTPAEATAPEQLRRAARQAGQLGVDLHVGLHLGDDPAGELQSLRGIVGASRPPAVWLLISADEQQVAAARAFLKQTEHPGRLGRGEDTNFTELNRTRPDPSRIDAVSYGLNPQVHAFDNTSMMETLAIQGETVRSARRFVGDLLLLASPITLRKQALDEPPAPGELPANVDPRQVTPFAAAWTLGSIKSLAEAGADALTYYETVGWLGVMEAEGGSPLPDRFPSRPGALFPVYHVLREIGEFSDGRIRMTTSSDLMSIVGLTIESDDRRRLLIANLTPAGRTTDVLGFAPSAQLRVITADATTGGRAAANDARGGAGAGTGAGAGASPPQRAGERPQRLSADAGGQLTVELPPYGIAVLDSAIP